MSVETLPTPQPNQQQTGSNPVTPGPLPPVPIPVEHQWRYFRVSILPFLMFGAVLGLTIWLWGQNLACPLISGQVEGFEASIVSPMAGRIIAVNVELHQEVKAGDVIALVDFTEPAVRSNALAAIRAEMEMIKAEGGFSGGDRVRYSQFKLDKATRQVEHGMNKLAVPVQETELARLIDLQKNKFESISLVESNKLLLDQLKLSVEQTEPALAEAEKALSDLDPSKQGELSKYVQAALSEAEGRLHLTEAEMQPFPLRAPINGRVDKLFLIQGSTVPAGGVIMSIASPKPERIIGFIHQPVRIEPQVGMKVTVRSRGLRREAGMAQITSIGPRMDTITNALRSVNLATTSLPDLGLPVVLTVPEKMALRPGELVDLTLMIE